MVGAGDTVISESKFLLSQSFRSPGGQTDTTKQTCQVVEGLRGGAGR